MTVTFGGSITAVLSTALFVLAFTVRHVSLNDDHLRRDQSPDDGQHRLNKRFYKGKEVSDNQYPYIVFLKSFLYNSDADCVQKMCTGTLIHPRFVITLNNCVNNSRFNADSKSETRVSENVNFVYSS